MPIHGQSAPTVSAARAAYLDELAAANLPTDVVTPADYYYSGMLADSAAFTPAAGILLLNAKIDFTVTTLIHFRAWHDAKPVTSGLDQGVGYDGGNDKMILNLVCDGSTTQLHQTTGGAREIWVHGVSY